MKTVYIIHGWGGSPEEPLLQWLKSELEKKGYKAVVPAMPDTETPVIDAWVAKLGEIVKPGEDSILVGHSIGAQAIMRYAEKLPPEQTFAGAVFIAPWLTLILDENEEEAVARPWLTMPLQDEAIRQHLPRMVAIFSDNDPYVPIENAEFFKDRFGAQVVMETSKGHFTAGDGVSELTSALNAIESF